MTAMAHQGDVPPMKKIGSRRRCTLARGVIEEFLHSQKDLLGSAICLCKCRYFIPPFREQRVNILDRSRVLLCAPQSFGGGWGGGEEGALCQTGTSI
ncbi:hypothetical protein CEXT_341291 [Caerostris extrusa]|uniref:Uncharacterized protein n=1 Tax=Caerostris extrusa TaxID=172846 RepID=A0AAV4U6A6_CAEEX|nr:hypothetical protein CEXT_341291 [Caerostris extrusa]